MSDAYQHDKRQHKGFFNAAKNVRIATSHVSAHCVVRSTRLAASRLFTAGESVVQSNLPRLTGLIIMPYDPHTDATAHVGSRRAWRGPSRRRARCSSRCSSCRTSASRLDGEGDGGSGADSPRRNEDSTVIFHHVVSVANKAPDRLEEARRRCMRASDGHVLLLTLPRWCAGRAAAWPSLPSVCSCSSSSSR